MCDEREEEVEEGVCCIHSFRRVTEIHTSVEIAHSFIIFFHHNSEFYKQE